MPTYEYQCEKCNQRFEVFQSMKDGAYTVCPKEFCRLEAWGAGTVKRLIGTGAGLIFKGSGFYITDYRSPNYKESAKKESGTKEGGPKEGGTKEGGTKEGGAPKSDGAKGGTEKSTGSSGSAPSTGSSNAAPSTGS
jgi:putative FmdB family regulatory protein